MKQLHFLVAGNLSWRLDLKNVTMDDYLSGQASAKESVSGVVGSALAVSQVIKQMRARASVMASVGDDLYGRMIVNHFDQIGIDSELIALEKGRATAVECSVNAGKKDSLTIKTAPKYIRRYDFEKTEDVDWFYLADGCGDLTQLNEFLHQAFLAGAKTILQVSELAASDVRRFGYLLEDVNLLIVSDGVAKKITDQVRGDLAAQALVREVDVVLVIGKKQVVVCDQNHLVTAEIAVSDKAEFGASFTVGYARKKSLAEALAIGCAMIAPDSAVKISERSL